MGVDSVCVYDSVCVCVCQYRANRKTSLWAYVYVCVWVCVWVYVWVCEWVYACVSIWQTSQKPLLLISVLSCLPSDSCLHTQVEDNKLASDVPRVFVPQVFHTSTAVVNNITSSLSLLTLIPLCLPTVFNYIYVIEMLSWHCGIIFFVHCAW